MRFTVLSGAILSTYAIAGIVWKWDDIFPTPAEEEGSNQTDADSKSENDILKDLQIFKEKTLPEINIVFADVGHGLVRTATYILTDNLRLHANKKVFPALKNSVSAEGIIDHIGDLIRNRSRNTIFRFPGHEGIVNKVGSFRGILDAEENLSFRYNSLISSDGHNREQVGGNLGSLILRGFSKLTKVPVSGDLVGYPYYGPPPPEGLFSEQGNNGILTNSGKLLLKGAVKSAKSLIRSLFQPIDHLHKQSSLLLARGQFNGYANLEDAVEDVLVPIRDLINHEDFSHASECTNLAELNETKLFDQYVQNSQQCHNSFYPQSQQIIKWVFDILLDAFHLVGNLQRAATNCFQKFVQENRHRCLEQEVPSLIASIRKKVREYSGKLQEHVLQFSNLNTEFDICVTKQLGLVKRVVYDIENDFRSCVEQHGDEEIARR